MKTLIVMLFAGMGLFAKAQNSAPLEVFPNPATDHVFVQIPPSFTGITYIFISDIDGKVYYRAERNFDGQDQGLLRRSEIPLNRLTPGTYIVNIRNEQDWRAQQLVKE